MSATSPDSSLSRSALRPVVTTMMPPLKAPRLMDQVRERIRYLHYTRSTEEAYVYWCKAFIRFTGLRHPRDMGGAIVAIDDGIALRVAIIIGDRSSAEAQELAQRALERALATSASHPQLWEIKIHTTGEYVTTKPG